MSKSGKKKNYKISTSKFGHLPYLIVRYKGSYPSGSLYIRCSYKDIIIDEPDPVLSIYAIVGIVIGSIVFLSILIIVLFFFFRRRRKIEE